MGIRGFREIRFGAEDGRLGRYSYRCELKFLLLSLVSSRRASGT